MTEQLRAKVLEFVGAFDHNDLDKVMSCFAEDAEYIPPDGSRHRGKAAIRAAFAPQFEGLYGAMSFPLEDMLIDAAARKVAIRWRCEHVFKPGTRRPGWRELLLKNVYGRRCHWHGMDVFHFDDAGLITGKYSYANTLLPLFKRDG